MKEKNNIFLLKLTFIIAILLLGIIAILFLLPTNTNDITIKNNDYLAGDTIPADAKIYPIMDENMPMVVVNNDGFLTDEDIKTITRYVDLFASLDDKRGENYNPDEVKFLTTRGLTEVMDNISAAGNDYEVKSVQILKIDVEDPNRVETAYAVQLSGCANDIPEGDYIAISGLYFKRVNGNWYEDGIGSYLFEKDGTIEIITDSITGEVKVQDKE